MCCIRLTAIAFAALVLFPQMYSSFTADQYMSIFAIAIPYTNYSE